MQVQNFFGQKMVQPFNGNLSLLQNLSAIDGVYNDLIRVRSRGVQRREFEVVKNIQAEAEKRYLAKIKSLEDYAAETQRELNDLMSNREAKNQRVILPPDIQKEIADLRAKEARTNKGTQGGAQAPAHGHRCAGEPLEVGSRSPRHAGSGNRDGRSVPGPHQPQEDRRQMNRKQLTLILVAFVVLGGSASGCAARTPPPTRPRRARWARRSWAISTSTPLRGWS